ncbi:uncharacterized protein LOC132543885 [Ylistrum balloti]|uniref:uncharacterized protein LOC132543885 n=1 Tax=Ylistrum balloti TaxID=509963 RepID=UPI00290581A5|nr:uncharacterized protein LOC132543885 [Ylistrum balloti]
MALSSNTDRDKSFIAAKLWAAARNTMDMLTKDACDAPCDTSFNPIEHMLNQSSCDEKDDINTEEEIMDMGLKIDSVFTLPLDTYLEEKSEEHISRPIEQIIQKDRLTKALEAQCKPFSVVLQNIDHDLAGRHRVFYRQWKRRFDKCGKSCRYKYIDGVLRPRPKVPKKTRKPYMYKKDTRNTSNMSRSCLENVSRQMDVDEDASLKANVDNKQSSNKKSVQLRDLMHKKSLSDQVTRLAEDHVLQTKATTEKITLSKQCASETLRKVKVKIEPGIEEEKMTPEDESSTYENVKVKTEPSNENSIDADIDVKPGLVSLLKKRKDFHVLEEMVKYSTLKGILGTDMMSEGNTSVTQKKTVEFKDKPVTTQSAIEVLKSKSKFSVPGELPNVPHRISTPFPPYKCKKPNMNVDDNSKCLNASSNAQGNQDLKTLTNTVPLMQNSSVFLTTGNHVSSPQVPLQLLLAGINSTGTQNTPQMILTSSNSPQLVLTGLNAQPRTQNQTQIVLTGTNATNIQNPGQLILTNSNQFTNTNQPQIILTTTNRPPTTQCPQILITNNDSSGTPQLLLANTNSKLSVSQNAPNLPIFSNSSQSVASNGQQQIVYANVFNPNQANVLQTGQLVINQPIQQLQQQPNLLNIPATPHAQSQIINGTIVSPVQRPGVGAPTFPGAQQPIPVIQTSSILPNKTPFPPGTIVFKRNSLPEARSQPGQQAMIKLMAEKQAKKTAADNERIVENKITQSNLSMEGKTVTIGNQKYLLVPAEPTSSAQAVANAVDKNTESRDQENDGFSKPSVAKKMKLLLERNEAIKSQSDASTNQHNKAISNERILHDPVPSNVRQDKLPTVKSASCMKGTAQNTSNDPEKSVTFVSNNTMDGDDIICIDDTEISGSAENKCFASLRKRDRRKSKPKPRLDYDEVLNVQQKSQHIHSSSDDHDTDSEVDIETLDIVGKGMLIPKTPTMPSGVREWPKGATISEKSITLPANMLENMEESSFSG